MKPKKPNWLSIPIMLLRSEMKLQFRHDETKFLLAHPEVRRMKFKPRNYILKGRVYK